MDFSKRLQDAIARGNAQQKAEADAKAAEQLSEEEFKRLHADYRIELCDYIENLFKEVVEQIPGFRYATIMDERGWGSEISRRDFAVSPRGERGDKLSRLQMYFSKATQYHVLEINGKATIRDKELYRRSVFRELPQASKDVFKRLVDHWVIEFAEKYSSAD